jgi:Kef-type K+ transport system membrane component KefB
LESIAIVIFVVGVLIAAGLCSKLILPRLSVHPLIGYILTGVLFRWLDVQEHFLLDQVLYSLMFLAEIGVIILLFHAGMESNIASLLQQLPHAVWIWFWNVVISGVLGFVAAYHFLGFSLIPSLFAATALTATSIGVAVAIWETTELSQSKEGQLFLDVAELDDLSSIALLALLLALVPVLASGTGMISATLILETAGKFLLTFLLFVIGCSLFSAKVEPVLSHWVTQRQTNHDHMLMIIAIGLMIAALAEGLGLSLAIGAFFGGLAFSRDPETARERMCFQPLYDFFTPFFFIGIGLHIDPTAFAHALWPGLLLLTAAVIGKVIGAGAPVVTGGGMIGAAVTGISMVPRAEIAMIVMEKGFDLGSDIVPQKLFAAMVIVVAGTTLLTPAILPSFVRAWSQKK